jgi:hypothetical protein
MKFKWGEKTKHPLYWTWRGMLLRCSSKHSAHYSKYSGRGISVCHRWRSFENFLHDMGDRPDGMTLDRINNDGNYEPGNCQWASKRAQSRNRRNIRPLTLRGETKLLTDWASEMGIRPSTLSMRIDKYGWSIEKALTTPIRRL